MSRTIRQMPHTIRLRRPWTCCVVDHAITFRRKFNRPTGLDEDSRITCCVRLADATLAAAALNQRNLEIETSPDVPIQRWDITHLLTSANELELKLESIVPINHSNFLSGSPNALAKLPDQPPGEVWLEIV